MKKVAIVGASGFVGSYLQTVFQNEGYVIAMLNSTEMQKEPQEITSMLEGASVIINLAGAPIIHRWSEAYKKVLYGSRIDTTKKLVEAMQSMKHKPDIFFSTSAIGIYATDGPMSETHFTYGDNFLSTICKDWEKEALKAKSFSRVVIFRFGVVLGKNGGALQKMLPAFKLGIAGTIGDGSEPFSWVHMKDLSKAYLFAIQNTNLEGIYNLTAPNPVTNKILTKTLGKILHRPTVIPLPKFVLKVIFSEGASVLTEGQRVIPERLLQEGFVFEFAELEDALGDVLST